MSNPPADESFFETERRRLINEITSGFEELMTCTNDLNRKLEEVHAVGMEFSSVAALWSRFQGMVRDNQREEPADSGVPGTGGANFGASSRPSK